MTSSSIHNFCNYINSIIDDKRPMIVNNFIIINNYISTIDNNKIMENDEFKIGCLISKILPSLSIEDYIKHVLRCGIIETDNINGIILYTINMLKHLKNKGLKLNSYNCHRIIITLFMLSSKIHEEFYYSNASWAEACGTNTQDINAMEVVILKLLDYNLNISISPHIAINIYKCIY